MENCKQTSNVRQLLSDSTLTSLEAQILLADVLGWTRTQLITRADETIGQEYLQAFFRLKQRRIEGEPIAYLLGKREFFGLEFHITPDVLIPRPETEGLVECGLEALYGKKQARVLELGTGSGAVAIALAYQCPEIEILATDRCARALAVAATNAKRLLAADRPGGPIRFAQGDWYGALDSVSEAPSFLSDNVCQTLASNAKAGDRSTAKCFDLIVSNPPYIASDDIHCTQGDLRFEPVQALTDGADGLQALYAIIQGAPDQLRAGGALWLEHGYDQAVAVRAALHAQGAMQIRSVCDLAGIERVTGGLFV